MKTIAFHLPQFHPIPQNDTWWGRGFTEWTNVTKARPKFHSHYQPHLPADLGFYDLRLPEAREAQYELAKTYGISGFCYYHYWFAGKRVLNRPVDEILESKKPDFPFCLCWANESWTRAWDGRSGDVILDQVYSSADDQAHIEHLLPFFDDPRYIRIEGRPLFLVYRAELLPDPKRTADIWRTAARRAGIGEIYLACVESFVRSKMPESYGFDAAVEFAPDWRCVKPITLMQKIKLLSTGAPLHPGFYKHRIVDYHDVVHRMSSKPEPNYRRFPCVTPGFDNSARRAVDATILINSTPSAYGTWLKQTLQREYLNSKAVEEPVVFINAWNEWAEGNHLEPDQKWGSAYLEAHRDAVATTSAEFNDPKSPLCGLSFPLSDGSTDCV